jgi:hypothetical protein
LPPIHRDWDPAGVADLLLSACLRAPVIRDGSRIGELADLGAAPTGSTPLVTGLVVARRHEPSAWADWRAVQRLAPDGVVLGSGAAVGPVPSGVLLARDVLDAQLVDVAGRRVVRVGDVDLRITGDSARVEGVEVGLDSVLRRLGLRRLAHRAPRRTIPWSNMHLPARPGAALSLDSAKATLAQLSDTDRARLAARLPVPAEAHLRPPRHLIPHRFPIHLRRRRRAPR